MTITLTDPQQSFVKVAINENDFASLARYKALGYYEEAQPVVEVEDKFEEELDEEKVDGEEAPEVEEEIEADEPEEEVEEAEEKPKPRRKRRTVEK